MLKKNIIGGLFLRNDKHVFTVFDNDDSETGCKYSLICLDMQLVVASYNSLRDLKFELSCGYTLVGRFEELDIESLIQGKTLHEETY